MYYNYTHKLDLFRQCMTGVYVYFMAVWYFPITTYMCNWARYGAEIEEKIWVYNLFSATCDATFKQIRWNIKGSELVKEGVILSNHVSMVDGLMDAHIQDAHVVARKVAINLCDTMRLFRDNRFIIINRSSVTSQELATRILEKLTMSTTSGSLSCDKRVLIYPEGTRKRYYFASFFGIKSNTKLLLEEFFMSKIIEKGQNKHDTGFLTSELIRTNLKFGTCLSIYDMSPNTRFQIVISRNKETLFQNKPCTVHIYRGKVFRPSDFSTKELFMDHIVTEWMRCCKEASFPIM